MCEKAAARRCLLPILGLKCEPVPVRVVPVCGAGSAADCKCAYIRVYAYDSARIDQVRCDGGQSLGRDDHRTGRITQSRPSRHPFMIWWPLSDIEPWLGACSAFIAVGFLWQCHKPGGRVAAQRRRACIFDIAVRSRKGIHLANCTLSPAGWLAVNFGGTIKTARNPYAVRAAGHAETVWLEKLQFWNSSEFHGQIGGCSVGVRNEQGAS